MEKKLIITGIRGLPANHGGFETFAQVLALYLVERGWAVTVYCQVEANRDGSTTAYESLWQGINLIHIPVKGNGALATIYFDWLTLADVTRRSGIVLTLGYNTALFNLRLKWHNYRQVINMDGIEWQRRKWSLPEKIWLYLNERAACWIANQLIADHPKIAEHLHTRVQAAKVVMIPYGATAVASRPPDCLCKWQLGAQQYVIVIARPEPENHILEIVTAFVKQRRACELVVLGDYRTDHSYQASVLAAANDQVHFLGAIYDADQVTCLRQHAKLYVHGHSVGGTNPSLVEAMAAKQPVLAHDNPYNRWVVGEGAVYFSDVESCASALTHLLANPSQLAAMSRASELRFSQAFQWPDVLSAYEQALLGATTE